MAEIDSKIIDDLGGNTVVSRLIRTPVTTVHSWRSIGIPPARLHHMQLAAKDAGIEINWPEATV